jgi:acylphosphatase
MPVRLSVLRRGNKLREIKTVKEVKARVLLDGKVQGVGLRYRTQQKAQELGLTGFVRNLTDGRVEVEFEGVPDKVDDLLNWFQSSDLTDLIDTIAVRYEEAEGRYSDFRVRN